MNGNHRNLPEGFINSPEGIRRALTDAQIKMQLPHGNRHEVESVDDNSSDNIFPLTTNNLLLLAIVGII